MNKIKVANLWMPTYFSEELKDFVQKLIVKDKRFRINLKDVELHPWIVKNTKEN